MTRWARTEAHGWLISRPQCEPAHINSLPADLFIGWAAGGRALIAAAIIDDKFALAWMIICAQDTFIARCRPAS